MHFFNEECSNSASFMPVSVWQTVLKNFHTPLVWSPADRTKVVTMAALLKFTGLETFKFFILSRLSSGFSAFRSWKSPTASSSTEHKAAACCICMIVSSCSPSCRFIFLLAGGSSFCLAGKSSWDTIDEGLSDGRECVLVRFRGWDRSADWDLGSGIW